MIRPHRTAGHCALLISQAYDNFGTDLIIYAPHNAGQFGPNWARLFFDCVFFVPDRCECETQNLLSLVSVG